MAEANPEHLDEILSVYEEAFRTRVLPAARRAIQKLGPELRAETAQLYAEERYADRDSGRVTRIEPFTERWRHRKQQLRYDHRRGHASLGISKVSRRTNLVTKTETGLLLDWEAAARTQTTVVRNRMFNSRRKKFKRPPTSRISVASYINQFARQKAPGLGGVTDSFRKKVRDEVEQATGGLLAKLDKSASNIRRTVRLDLRLNRVLLEEIK